MSRHLIAICNSRSANIQFHVLDTADWSLIDLGAIAVPGATGPGDAAPMAVSRSGNRFWLAWRGENRAIHSFKIDRSQPCAMLVGSFPVEHNICHLSLSGDEEHLLAAGGEDGVVFSLDHDGRITRLTDRVEAGPMAHCLMASGHLALATSCRGHLVRRFDYDPENGTLRFHDQIAMEDNSGPRHLAISADGRFAYVLLQEGGKVVTISLGTEMKIVDTLAIVDGNTPAMSGEISLCDDGRSLLVTERNTNRLMRLVIDPDTRQPALRDEVIVPDYPRAFFIDSKGQFVTTLGFRSNRAAVHSVTTVGGFVPRLEFATGERPSWVVSLELDEVYRKSV
jgi:6-phosphogluconolactonase